MITQIIITSLVLGLVSGFHCVGMCGPLMFSLPFANMSSDKKWLSVFIYHFGRISTYITLGVLVGWAGKFFFIHGYQQKLSIALGILILVMLVSYTLNKTYVRIGFIARLTKAVQQFIIKQYQQISLPKIFVIGAANGLLPCGMIYFALTGAMATQTITNAAVFMLFFGLGTLPLLILVSTFRFFINISARNFMKKMVPFFIATMGILLIIRGLNLNIPYLSPSFQDNQAAVSCH